MSYVDGYVLPVPKKNLAAYRRMATDAGKVWMKNGALQYVETVADDVDVGKRTSFPRSVKLKRGEVVVFSFIVYRSRGQRDNISLINSCVRSTAPGIEAASYSSRERTSRSRTVRSAARSRAASVGSRRILASCS